MEIIIILIIIIMINIIVIENLMIKKLFILIKRPIKYMKIVKIIIIAIITLYLEAIIKMLIKIITHFMKVRLVK